MRRLLPTVAVLAAALIGAGFASGELAQSGNLRLAFNGGFEPRLLPRDRLAPVSFDLSGSIAGVDGASPPPVRSLSIAVNRYGRISTRGLPVCLRGRLQQTSTQEALARCRPALIGRGRFTANVDFSNGAFAEEGAALAFNGRAGRHPAVLVQIHGDAPVEATIVLVFKISHPRQGPLRHCLHGHDPEDRLGPGLRLQDGPHLQSPLPFRWPAAELSQRALRGAPRLSERRLQLRPRQLRLRQRPAPLPNPARALPRPTGLRPTPVI